MSKRDWVLTGYGIDELANSITDGILNASVSATLEDSSYFSSGNVSCTVLVFERYSIIGSNRLSLTVSLFSEPGCVRISTRLARTRSSTSSSMCYLQSRNRPSREGGS